MRTAIAHSSIRAHDLLSSSGELQAGERAVLDAMQPGQVYSNRQLAHLISRETSFVAGRVNSLTARGLIETIEGHRCTHTGRTVDGRRLAEKVLQGRLC